MKFGHLIEYNKKDIFLQKLCRKWGRETSFRSILFFQKVLCEGKGHMVKHKLQVTSCELPVTS